MSPTADCVITGKIFLGEQAAEGARIELRTGIERPKSGEANAVAGPDGAFELRVASGGASLPRLTARLHGHELSQDVELSRGERIDLGVLHFPPPATIVGHIADESENLPPVEMWVRARTPHSEDASDGEGVARAHVDPATRAFVLEGLPCCKLELVLELPHWPEVEKQELEPLSGTRTEVELAYSGRNLTRGVWAHCECAQDAGPIADVSIQPSRDHVRLLTGGESAGEPLRYRGVFLFPRVSSGFHELVVDDPRFREVRVTALQAGEGASVSLVGSSSIRLRVIDVTTDLPTTRYSAWLVTTDSRNFHQLEDESRPPPSGGLYAEIGPGWEDLVVAADHGLERVSLGRLVPGKTFEVEVTPGKKHAVRGKVVGEDDDPLAEVEILLESLSPEQAARATRSSYLLDRAGRQLPAELVEARTIESWLNQGGEPAPARIEVQTTSGPDGTFTFEEVPSGPWILRTVSETHVSAVLAIDVKGRDRSGITLFLVRGGRWTGRFLAPSGIALENCRVTLDSGRRSSRFRRRGSGPPQPLANALPETFTFSLDREGRLQTPLLRPGEYRFELQLPDGSSLAAENIELEAGQVLEHDVEIAALLPGWLEIDATWNGVPAKLSSLGVVDPESYLTSEVTELDESGRAHIGPVAPGDHVLCMTDNHDSALRLHLERVHVESSVTKHLRIDAHPFPGRLSVTTLDRGEPQPSLQVFVESEWLPYHRLGARETDTAGMLELALSPGRYRFHGSLPTDGECGWIEWTKEGPVPASVALPEETTRR